MINEVLSVCAEYDPMPNVVNPGPHQTYKDSQIIIENRALNDLDPNQIRVKMLFAGICGTDVHAVEHDPVTKYIKCSAPLSFPKTAPGRIIGHEGVGLVVAAGKNISHIKKGAYVSFESIEVCYHCAYCRQGAFNQCENAKLLGLERDGLFGSVVDVPASIAHDISPYVQSDNDLKAFALLEPAAVAYVACENANIIPGNKVLVFGAGPIGLLAGFFAKRLFGASYVEMIEPLAFRRELAKRVIRTVYGVDEFFDNSCIRFDVVIEASGQVGNINRVLRRINACGRVILLARSGQKLTIEAMDHLITNAIYIKGSRGHLGGAFNKLISIYAQDRSLFLSDDIITSELGSLAALKRILENSDQILGKNCKVLIKFNE